MADFKDEQIYEFGSFQLRAADGVLLKNGKVVSLTPKALKILLMLVQRHGQMIEKEEILNQVWADTYVEESSVLRNISVLRKILQDDDTDNYIETFHRRGYRFVAPLKNRDLDLGANADAAKQIAVLPFTLLNPNQETEYLGIGLADTLITHLSNFSQIVVRPVSSVIKYADADPLQAARELLVQYVVYGSVQSSGERLRVNLQLGSVAANRPVWGANFDSRLTDILEIQDSIANQAIKLLLPQLSAEEVAHVPPTTTDSAAYQLYLRGRFYWNKRTLDNLHKAIQYMSQAIAQDSAYALAWAALADCYLVLVELDYAHREAHYKDARRAAAQALKLNPNLGEAVAALAHVRFFDEWNAVEAENLYRRAIEIAPNYAIARHWYGVYLTARGRFDEALSELRHGVTLDPLSLPLNRSLAAVLSYADLLDESIVQFEATLEIEPDFIPAVYGLAITYKRLNQFDVALRLLETCAPNQAQKSLVRSGLAQVYAHIGRADEARIIINDAETPLSPMQCAIIYHNLNEPDQVIRSLNQAVDEHDSSVLYLKVYPDFKNLHDDSRFQKIIARIG